MLWLKNRLQELNKSGAAFGRALGIPKERVYEMFRGDRRLQPEEIGPAARFLQWSEADIVRRLEGLNENKKQPGQIAAQQVENAPKPYGDINLPPLVVYRTARMEIGRQGGFMLYAERTDEVPRPFFLKFSKKAFAVKVLDDTNEPVYRRWDTVMVDPGGNSVTDEDCLFTAYHEAIGGSPSIIGRLLSSTETHWTVRQYGMDGEFALARSTYPNAFPIVGRYNRR